MKKQNMNCHYNIHFDDQYSQLGKKYSRLLDTICTMQNHFTTYDKETEYEDTMKYWLMYARGVFDFIL